MSQLIKTIDDIGTKRVLCPEVVKAKVRTENQEKDQSSRSRLSEVAGGSTGGRR